MPDGCLFSQRLSSAENCIGSARGRTLMTLFTAPNRLRVWWCAHDYVAARAAALCRRHPTTGSTWIHPEQGTARGGAL